MDNYRIKILSPIDRIEEAIPLIRAGADEFFCGVIMNGVRTSCQRAMEAERCNLTNLEELDKLAHLLKKHKKKIFLAVNFAEDSLSRLELVERKIKRIKKIDLNGLIIGNVNLMERLRKHNLKIVASSLLEAKNEEAVGFLINNFRVKRIILDRQITSNDFDRIVSIFPKTEVEVFVLGAGCRSLNSACKYFLFARHGFRRHLCNSRSHISKNNKKINFSLKDKKIVIGRLQMPFKSCGACALFYFKKNKVTSVKIVGRGYPTELKIANVRFIKEAINTLGKNYPPKKFYQKMEELFEKSFHKKCKRQYCYYPHFFDD